MALRGPTRTAIDIRNRVIEELATQLAHARFQSEDGIREEIAHWKNRVAELTREAKAIRGRPAQVARLRNGKCMLCDEPLVPGRTMCQGHLDDKREAMQRRRGLKHVGACSRCKQTGHNARSCRGSNTQQ